MFQAFLSKISPSFEDKMLNLKNSHFFAQVNNISNCFRKETAKRSQILTNLPTIVHYTRSLFNQDVFYNKQDEKKKLVSHLQSYVNSEITRTQLLYKYDIRNKDSIYKYIDKAQRLAIFIKTKNAIIAGFYPGMLKNQGVLDQGGILVFVTNNQSYVLYKTSPSYKKMICIGIFYGSFLVVFGNRGQQSKLVFKEFIATFELLQLTMSAEETKSTNSSVSEIKEKFSSNFVNFMQFPLREQSRFINERK